MSGIIVLLWHLKEIHISSILMKSMQLGILILFLFSVNLQAILTLLLRLWMCIFLFFSQPCFIAVLSVLLPISTSSVELLFYSLCRFADQMFPIASCLSQLATWCSRLPKHLGLLPCLLCKLCSPATS